MMLRGLVLGVALGLFAGLPVWGQPGPEDLAPLLTVPASTAGPVVDGVIGAEEWARAAGPFGFQLLGAKGCAPAQPEVLVLRGPEALYVVARLPLPEGTQPKVEVTQRDGQVWTDDAFEVFVDRGRTGAEYRQFIVNSGGVRWDSKGRDGAWDGEWEAEAEVGAEAWTVEVRLPFAVLGGVPEEGEEWGLNFAWDRQTPEPMVASWAPLGGSLHEPGAFGVARFVAEAPSLRAACEWPTDEDMLKVRGGWPEGGPYTARLRSFRLANGEQQPMGDTKAAGSAPNEFTLGFQVERDGGYPRAGEYLGLITLSAEEELLGRACVRVVCPEPLKVAARRYLLAGYVEVDIEPADLGVPGDQLAGVVELRRGGQLVERHEIGSLNEKRMVRLATDGLAGGEYDIVVLATSMANEVLRREAVPLEKPERPEWLGTQEGISDEVLPPWTPLETDGTAVLPWGRRYEFGALPFPGAVTTGGRSVLAGPIRLVLNGKAIEWAGEAPRFAERAPHVVKLRTEAKGGRLTCEGEVVVEYDGMIRADFSLAPEGEVAVESLALEIPFRAEHARYLYHYPGRWGSAYNAGALPEEGFTAGFRPFIWLGDEERGLCWFSESDRNFFIEKADEATQIRREGDQVVLRVNIIDRPETITAPLEYTFGFEATPIRPNPQDVWDYRICHHGSYGIETQPWRRAVVVEYPAEGHLDLKEGTFEAWVRPQFDTDPPIAPDDPGRGQYNRDLLSVALANGDVVGFYWNIDDRGMRMYVKQGDKYPIIIGGGRKLTRDQWHHVALTWGDEARIYVDGELAASRPFAGLYPGTAPPEAIRLGGNCGFDLDGLRISKVAREEFSLDAPLTRDQHTLLIDQFDGQTAGDVSLEPVWTEGKFGRAIALHRPGAEMTLLDRLAELGVRTICFHEHWTDIQDYPITTHGEELHSLVKACHERGIKLVVYFGYEMSNIAPEWDLYSDECLVFPRAGGYHRQPEQRAYIVCFGSAWQDFLADGIARVMDEYDLDGVYLDGTANPWGCSNVHHGCGYERPDGSVGTTYRFFDAREMMKRIRTIVKSRKPDGIVNLHQSTCMTIPSIGWATSYWDGEQFGSLPRETHDALEVLPLDAFRCEFMGHQWGVPAELLCYNRPYTYREAMSFALLHDVLVRGSLGGGLELESKLWHAMGEFGRKEAEWIPYWRSEGVVTASPAEIKVSLYSRGGEGLMAVISNLGERARTARVQFDLGGLGLQGRLQARDVVSDEDVPIRGGRLQAELEPLGFAVIRVRPR